jgi:hypothetical protein
VAVILVAACGGSETSSESSDDHDFVDGASRDSARADGTPMDVAGERGVENPLDVSVTGDHVEGQVPKIGNRALPNGDK